MATPRCAPPRRGRVIIASLCIAWVLYADVVLELRAQLLILTHLRMCTIQGLNLCIVWP